MFDWIGDKLTTLRLRNSVAALIEALPPETAGYQWMPDELREAVKHARKLLARDA